MPSPARLFASVSAAQQQRFVQLASARGQSTSSLMALLVDAALAQNPLPPVPGAATAPPLPTAPARAGRPGRSDRKAATTPPAAKYTVRLSGIDAAKLAERAAARQLSASTYAAHVLLAHLRAAPPLPYGEFETLKRVVNELGGIRAGLNAIVAGKIHPGALNDVLGEAVRRLLPALKSIREDVQTTLQANSRSWEAPDA